MLRPVVVPGTMKLRETPGAALVSASPASSYVLAYVQSSGAPVVSRTKQL